MRKITDFGEKIGGARKDLWRTHGIQEEDGKTSGPLPTQGSW